MCTYTIFPNTPVGPVLGFSLDDALEWANSPTFASGPFVQEPQGSIYKLSVGGGGCELEQEAKQVYPFRPETFDCQNLNEAEELLTRYGDFPDQPHHAGYIDLDTLETLAIDKTLGAIDSRRTDDGVIFDTYGGYQSVKLAKLCDQNGPLFEYYKNRMSAMTQIIDAHSDQLGIDAMWQVLLDRTPGGEVCQHADTRPKGIQFVTLATVVIAPRQGKQWIRWLKNGRPPAESDPVEYAWGPQSIDGDLSR